MSENKIPIHGIPYILAGTNLTEYYTLETRCWTSDLGSCHYGTASPQTAERTDGLQTIKVSYG